MATISESQSLKGTKLFEDERVLEIVKALHAFSKGSKVATNDHIVTTPFTPRLRLDPIFYTSQKRVGQTKYDIVRLGDCRYFIWNTS